MANHANKNEPPPGFVVRRACELDPLFGAFNRWAYRGRIGARTIVASGMQSYSAACEAAWEAVG